MKYVGLDVHSRQSTFCVLDQNGKKVLTRTIQGSWGDLIRALTEIETPFAICFEASTGYGFLFDHLRKIASSVQVAHPGQLRLIFRSKRKNDRVDAEKLAKLLFLGEVPQVFVPSENIRAWRAMIEHRQRLIRERTRVKNQIRALLRTHGISGVKGLWTDSGLCKLKERKMPSEFYELQKDILVERFFDISRMVKRVEKALNGKGRKNPGVQLLQTIPGVGVRTAEAVVAYIDKPDRFARTKSIGRYFGLVPCQDSSASKNRLGHITGDGPSTVRALLAEAAWQGIRRSKHIRSVFERLQRDDPERKKIALVATAHYLLRVMLTMLKTGELWRHDKAA